MLRVNMKRINVFLKVDHLEAAAHAEIDVRYVLLNHRMPADSEGVSSEESLLVKSQCHVDGASRHVVQQVPPSLTCRQ